MEPSTVPAPIVGGANKRVRSSSTVFATNSPNRVVWVVVVAMSAKRHTGFSFSDDDTASVEDVFELFEVKITISCTRGGASWDNRFLNSQLNGKSLENTGLASLRKLHNVIPRCLKTHHYPQNLLRRTVVSWCLQMQYQQSWSSLCQPNRERRV